MSCYKWKIQRCRQKKHDDIIWHVSTERAHLLGRRQVPKDIGIKDPIFLVDDSV